MDVYSPDGRLLGTSHGPDAAPRPIDVPADPSGRDPVCVQDLLNDSYVVVIYARPSDISDSYAADRSAIRQAVATANGAVFEAASARGVSVDLKVECDASGGVLVANATLPTQAGAADFSTIESDLEALGFRATNVHHLVFYDDPTHHIPYGGQGNFCDDDRASVVNGNNGAADCAWCPGCATFAIDYYPDWWIGLHELGHNLGAVQYSAPHTSGAAHCNDGLDVMCYADGGPSSHYTTTACAQRVWDCGHDDYFDAAPDAGTYLSWHWNIGSPIDRFTRWGDGTLAPTIQQFSCRIASNTTRECRFFASDDSPSVALTITWGDDTTTTFDPRPPNTPFVATHTYADARNVTIGLAATDSEGHVTLRSLDTATAPQNQAPVAFPPVCSPSPAYLNDLITCAVNSTDDSTGVSYTLDLGSSTWQIPFRGWSAPGEARSECCLSSGSPTTIALTLRATDDEIPSLTSAPTFANLSVLNDHRPSISNVSCDPTFVRANETLTCQISAYDQDNGSLRIVADWGDGTADEITGIPHQGEANASHAWTDVNRSYDVRFTVQDDFSPPASSAPSTRSVFTYWNVPPAITDFACTPTPTRANASVTCGFTPVDRDSDQVQRWIYLQDNWTYLGAGTPSERANLSTVYSTSGTRTIGAYAFDPTSNASAFESMQLNVLPAPTCNVLRIGQLVAGAKGADVPEISGGPVIDLPAECHGKPWSLNLTAIAPAGPTPVAAACFARSDGSSVCDNAVGGIIPATARSVHVVLQDGAAVSWRFTALG